MPGIVPQNNMPTSVARLRYQVSTFIHNEVDCHKFYAALETYRRDADLAKFVNVLKEVLNRPERLRVYDIVRPFIALPQQMDYNMLVPYVRGNVRVVRLKRPTGIASYGFAIRGGREHGIGVFVSQVDEESVAHIQGLKIGDQIIQVNGLKIDEAIHEEVLNLLKTGTTLELKVKSIGMIPVKSTISNGSSQAEELVKVNDVPDESSAAAAVRLRKTAVTSQPAVSDLPARTNSRPISLSVDPGQDARKISSISTRSRGETLSWQVVDIDSPTSPLTKTFSSNSSRSGDIQEVTVYLKVPPNQRFGCNICKGPSERPGIFIQSIRDGGLAKAVGLRAGDQIMEANGKSLLTMEFMEAVGYLKNSKEVELLIRKGAGIDLFPNDTSGYNSSNSSVHEERLSPKPIPAALPSVIESPPRICVEDKETGEVDCEDHVDGEKDADGAEVTVVATTVLETPPVVVEIKETETKTEVAPPPVINATVVVINAEPMYAMVDPERKKSSEMERETRHRQVEFRARQHREEERQVMLASQQTAAMVQVVDVDVAPTDTPTRVASWQEEEDNEEAERRRQLEYSTKMEEQTLEEEVEEILTKPGARGRRPSLLYANMEELRRASVMDRTVNMVRIAEAQVERNISRSSSSSSGGSSTAGVTPPPATVLADKWQKTVLAEIHNTPKPSVGLAEQNGHGGSQNVEITTTLAPTNNSTNTEAVRKISCEPSIPVNAEIQKRNQHDQLIEEFRVVHKRMFALALQERDRLGYGASTTNVAPKRFIKKPQPIQTNPVILTRGPGWVAPTTPTPMGNYSGARKNSLVPIIPPNLAPHKFLDPSPQIYGTTEPSDKDSAPDFTNGPTTPASIIINNNSGSQIPRTPAPISNNAAPETIFFPLEDRKITDSAQSMPKHPDYFFKPKPKVNVIVGSYADMINRSAPNRLEFLKTHPSVEIEMLKTEDATTTTPVPAAPKSPLPATKVAVAPAIKPTIIAVTNNNNNKVAVPPSKVTPPVTKSVTKVTLNQSPPTVVEVNTRPVSPEASSAFQEARARFGAPLRPVSGNGTAAESQQKEVTGAARRQRPPGAAGNLRQVPPERVIVIE